jgi:hypothetical protein
MAADSVLTREYVTFLEPMSRHPCHATSLSGWQLSNRLFSSLKLYRYLMRQTSGSNLKTANVQA